MGEARGAGHRRLVAASKDPLVPLAAKGRGGRQEDIMWPVLWTAIRVYAPYITFPLAFVVGAVGYNIEWFIRGNQQPVQKESIFELREERRLAEIANKDCTEVLSLNDKLEFAPRAVLNRNRTDSASRS
ncbi:small integral membrane protein 12 isoform X1 [Leucoraja erinacea]|uniref:small integral membrane protein 12 isoform X1 n=2 Tax=Leucoraja erinaceus TaxID=7782 RepID=UPI002457347E|nr:small integral membrane protein 12 isoform X1 [Leucoraja erinacea]